MICILCQCDSFYGRHCSSKIIPNSLLGFVQTKALAMNEPNVVKSLILCPSYSDTFHAIHISHFQSQLDN